MQRSLAILVLAALLPACTSLTPEDPLVHPDVRARLDALKTPLDLKVAVFVERGVEPVLSESYGEAFAPESNKVLSDLTGLLEKSGLYEKVYQIPRRDTYRKTPARVAEELGADVLIHVKAPAGRVGYIERNHLWWPSLALWLLAWFPSWLVPDETFSMDVWADIEVSSISGKDKPRRFVALGSLTAALNDIERGFHLFGIFRAPFCLSDGDWRGIRRRMGPRTWSRFHISFMKGLLDR